MKQMTIEQFAMQTALMNQYQGAEVFPPSLAL